MIFLLLLLNFFSSFQITKHNCLCNVVLFFVFFVVVVVFLFVVFLIEITIILLSEEENSVADYIMLSCAPSSLAFK